MARPSNSGFKKTGALSGWHGEVQRQNISEIAKCRSSPLVLSGACLAWEKRGEG